MPAKIINSATNRTGEKARTSRIPYTRTTQKRDKAKGGEEKGATFIYEVFAVARFKRRIGKP